MDECLSHFQEECIAGTEVCAQARVDCLQKLQEQDHLKRLAFVRKTVDEDICDVDNVCQDETEPFAGLCRRNVTQCYSTLELVRLEVPLADDADLFFRDNCDLPETWSGYQSSQRLVYCMWKQLNFGVCTNALADRCPSGSFEGSCCPQAQQEGVVATRRDNYQCSRDPKEGLYCHHYLFENTANQPCTGVTCPNFEWCMQYSDISGTCSGEACKLYYQAVVFLIICVGVTTLCFILDCADIAIMIYRPEDLFPKTAANVLSAFGKALAAGLVVAGGARDFFKELSQNQCYTSDGQVVAELLGGPPVPLGDTSIRIGGMIDGYLISTAVAACCSFILAPLSAYYGGKLIGVPYIKMKGGTFV
mmetsp:Transcript_73895/g.169343  ORF Transcript_73895/g.169343 Transcript_73895/m.169343 type:complete len:362 (+) Transcript_73895:203-1288(+)